MQSAHHGLRSLCLFLEDFKNNTDHNDAHQYENDAVGTRGLLVLLSLHYLLQTLLHLHHRLIHVIVDTVHDRSLLDHQLVQVLEDLGKLLRALRYGQGRVENPPICWISWSRDCVSFRIISTAPFCVWLKPYGSRIRNRLTVSMRSSSASVA